jgi:hypothetical protein
MAPVTAFGELSITAAAELCREEVSHEFRESHRSTDVVATTGMVRTLPPRDLPAFSKEVSNERYRSRQIRASL